MNVRFFTLCCLLYCFSPFSQAKDFQALLEQADSIKSADYMTFSRTINSIHPDYEQLTATQKLYFNYLNAYAIAYSGDFEQAVSKLTVLLRDNEPSELTFRIKSTLLNIYVLSKRYLDAFVIADELLHQDSRITDVRSKEQAYRTIAMLNNTVSNYDVAWFYANKVLTSAVEPSSICAAWQLRIEAMYFLRHRDFLADSATALTQCAQAGELIFQNIIVAYNARYYLDNQQSEQAIILLQQYYDDLIKANYPHLTAAFSALLARAFYDKQDYVQAEYYANRGVASGMDSKYTEPLAWSYQVLYRLARQKNDYQVALQWYEKYTETDKAYLDEKATQQLAYHRARNDIEIKNQRIELLDKDNELLHLQQNIYREEVKNNRLIMSLLILLVLISVLIAYKGLSGRRRFKLIAEFDQLTGISNRYHFNNQALYALEKCQYEGKPAALILFDLDRFKTINDEYGHAAGDWALQQVVSICRHFVRNNDVFGRIGGEEFAIVLPDCQADKAVLLAEICRDAINEIDTREKASDIVLSASFGVSSSDSSGYQLKHLLADADAAMYKAKQAGRNQVMSCS